MKNLNEHIKQGRRTLFINVAYKFKKIALNVVNVF